MINYKNISIFLALFAINNIIYFTPSFGNPYYFVMLVGLLLLLRCGEIAFYNFAIVCFIFAAMLSILLNDIPEVYNPWLRLATFVIVYSITGPLIKGVCIDKSKLIIFWTMRIGGLAVVLLSFFARFAGMGKVHGVNYYAGITVHSITLGLIASNALIYLLYLYYVNDNVSPKVRYGILFCLVLCFSCALSSGSRSAVLAGVGGASLFQLMVLRNYKNKWVKYLFLVLLAFIVTYPLWHSSLETIMQKNHGEITTLDMSSREGHWKRLFGIFQDNPAFGVGFSYLGDTYNNSTGGRGQVEPGNSWLVILTMTGILGGLSIGSILLKTILLLKKQYSDNQLRTAFLSSLLFCDFLQMCGEGYILAAGDYGFFNFWGLLGVIWAYSSQIMPIENLKLGQLDFFDKCYSVGIINNDHNI